MKNIFSKWIEQKKIEKQIIKKYNEILEINKSMENANTMKELLAKFEQQEKIYDEIKKIDVGYKEVVNTTKEDFEFQITSQIKMEYFSRMNHYLLDFNELDSYGYINGFLTDLKSCKSVKYNSFIKSFINDAQSVLDNHSIIYNNYRKNPIKRSGDKLSESLLEYICRQEEVSDEKISSDFNIDYYRIKTLFNYFCSQNIITEKDSNGKRKVLIRNPRCVYPSGLNPNELGYISVTYNYTIEGINEQKSLLEIIDNEMSGAEFEKITKEILEKNGFKRVKTTPVSGDFGVDVIAEKDSVKYVIQCKKYSSSVGIKAVQEIMGSKAMNNAHVAVVLTNNFFTKSAKELAKSNGVLLWDRDKLIEMLEKLKNK